MSRPSGAHSLPWMDHLGALTLGAVFSEPLSDLDAKWLPRADAEPRKNRQKTCLKKWLRDKPFFFFWVNWPAMAGKKAEKPVLRRLFQSKIQGSSDALRIATLPDSPG